MKELKLKVDDQSDSNDYDSKELTETLKDPQPPSPTGST